MNQRITFEIENSKELNLLIFIAEKLGIKKYNYSNSVKQKSSGLNKYYKIIDEGADISTFGNIKKWQKATREDRNLNFI